MLPDGYTCKECEIISPNNLKKFTPPPSTTVAMRHVREKHPEICKQIEEDERERKASRGIPDRKRASTASPNNAQNSAAKVEKTARERPPKQPRISWEMAIPYQQPNFNLCENEKLEQHQLENGVVEPVVGRITPLDLDSLKAMQKSTSSYEKSQLIKDDISEVLAVPQFSIQMLAHSTMQKLLHDMDPNVHLPSTSHDFYAILKEAKEKKVRHLQQIFENLPWRLNISYHIFKSDTNVDYVSVTAYYTTPRGCFEKAFLGTRQIEDEDIRGTILQILEKYGLKEDNVFKFVQSGSFSPSILSMESDLCDPDQNKADEIFDMENADHELKNLDLEKLQKEFHFESTHNAQLQKPLVSFEYALELAIQTAVGTASKNNGGLLKILSLSQRCQSSLANLYLKSTCQKWTPFPNLTGWGSIVVILNIFLKHKKQIFELAQQKSWEIPAPAQMSFLEELHQILYPFLNIFHKIHTNNGKNCIPISHVYSSVKYFIYALDSRMGERKGDAKVMSFILSEQLKSKFNFVVDSTDVDFDSLYLIAALLDPNFSHTVDPSMIGKISEEIYKMIRARTPPTSYISPTNSTILIKSEPALSPNDSEFDLPADTNPYLQSLFQTCQNIQVPTEISASNKETRNAMDPSRLAIQSYSSYALRNRTQNIDVTNFWAHCDPNFAPIKELAMEILSIPSAITNFSCTLDSILSQHKNDLKSGLLNDKIIVYLNKYDK
uniref:HAT C-terminal dimerisation domain-containing protein n=1 Tax=Acrobeloides nanus TaxID=290746 RepID=A0A914DD09_9BILA